MENNLKFNSAICTSREQSKRLLALGLKKETADMVLLKEMVYDEENHCTRDGEGYIIRPIDYLEGEEYRGHIPAWSLHRLLCMLPKTICDGRLSLRITDALSVHYTNKNSLVSVLDYYTIDFDIYDTVVFCIESFIKKGYFPKEYLEE